jgi:hypothetical protein
MSSLQKGPFPNPAQELLLKTALLNGSAARDAWRQWREMVDFETQVDGGSLRLLPLVYHNLLALEVDDPLMLRLKGIYRKAWSKNHLLFRKTAGALSLLHSAGIPTMVLKGIPLTLLYYRNHALRPMCDMDVMVPAEEADRALHILEREGWIIRKPHLRSFSLRFGRSMELDNVNGDELDLHWHPIFETHGDGVQQDFWDRAVELEVSGVTSLTLCPSDQLFHTLVHGLRCNNDPPIRWVPDAISIIRSETQPVDWQRLLDYTMKYRVSLQVWMALQYLVERFGCPVPDAVQQTLQSVKPGWTEKLIYRHATSLGDLDAGTFRQRVLAVYVGYIRQSEKRNLPALHLGFVRYVYHLTRGRSRFRLFIDYLMLLFRNQADRKQIANEEI